MPAPLDEAALTALARQALLDYGAQEVDGVLRCYGISLFYHDGWASFSELTGGRGSGLTYWAAPLRQNGDTGRCCSPEPMPRAPGCGAASLSCGRTITRSG